MTDNPEKRGTLDKVAETQDKLRELRQRRRRNSPNLYHMSDLLDLLRENYGIAITPLDVRHLERDGILPRAERGPSGERLWTLREIGGAVDAIRRHLNGHGS